MKEVLLSIKALDKSEKVEACLRVTFLGYRHLDRSSSLSLTFGDGILHHSLNFSLSRSQTNPEDRNNWEYPLTKKQVSELQILLEDPPDDVRLRFFPCIDIELKKNSYNDYLEPYKISPKIIESLLDEIRLLHV